MLLQPWRWAIAGETGSHIVSRHRPVPTWHAEQRPCHLTEHPVVLPAAHSRAHLRALRALGPRLIVILAHQADSRADAGRRGRLCGRGHLGRRHRRLRCRHRRSRGGRAIAAERGVRQRRRGHVSQARRIQRAGTSLLPAGMMTARRASSLGLADVAVGAAQA